MKKCPYCAEEIQDEAILCRYCGSNLQIKQEDINNKRENTNAVSDPPNISKKDKTKFSYIFSKIYKYLLILWAIYVVSKIWEIIEFSQSRHLVTEHTWNAGMSQLMGDIIGAIPGSIILALIISIPVWIIARIKKSSKN